MAPRSEGPAVNSHVRKGVESKGRISLGPEGRHWLSCGKQSLPHLRRSSVFEIPDPRPHGRGYCMPVVRT
jgi:hypothetical protein